MTYDRPITISTAGSRHAESWPASELLISELYERLRQPVRGAETMTEYLRLKKQQQDNLKDVGGFVAGKLKGGRRKSDAVESREVLTLDLDNVLPGGTDDVLRRVDGLTCGYCVYSTRKHRPDAPRLRVLLPLDRPVTADEYEPIARKAAELIDPDMRLFDPTTFQAVRLMYYPSCCKDSDYIFVSDDRPMLSADGMLAVFPDWQDIASWPQVPGQDVHKKLAAKQGDPWEKRGALGAFCRVYSIYDALEKFLPGVYTPTDMDDRYSFAGGSTTGGAIIYEDGKFLFSHHATDPAGSRLCNAFDLVRLHLFADQDDTAKQDTPVNKLPSYSAMTKLAVGDTLVIAELDKEREKALQDEFGSAGDDTAWKQKLERNGQGQCEKTINNILLILQNDTNVKGKIKTDIFASRGMAYGPFPWDDTPGGRIWTDNDDAGIRWYLERAYGITGKEKVMDGLSIYGSQNAFDPVKDYLAALQWDGTPRLDTLFVDYLGARDDAYVRAVTRKAFAAAVARTFEPGTKYDCMTILTGAQGIGKSTLLNMMAKSWFSDSLKTFEGKEACELIQGVWIVEIGELEAMNKSELGRVKQFLSQREDIFRQAYGRRTNAYPRRCVFFGTSNNDEYLRDHTGGRRFWPVDVGVQDSSKNIFTDLKTEVDQIWAEAVIRWRLGEELYLTGAVADIAKKEQEEHRERSPREGEIMEFVNRSIPEDWYKWDIQRRRMYWGGGEQQEIAKAPREQICAQEVWVEALGGDTKQMRYSDTVEINAAISRIPGWEKQKRVMRFGPYGAQRGFIKV